LVNSPVTNFVPKTQQISELNEASEVSIFNLIAVTYDRKNVCKIWRERCFSIAPKSSPKMAEEFVEAVKNNKKMERKNHRYLI
jgi:hypothetical protein